MACPRTTTWSWVTGSALALRDRELQVDQVESGDELGDGVLDLESGVHLEEEGVLAGDEELDGAGVDVADLAGQVDGRRGDDRADRVGDLARRRLLEHLLVAALDGAVTLVQVHDVAVLVGHDLHLDVPTVLDVSLEQHGVVAEGGRRLALCRRHGVGQLVPSPDDPHAFSTAARRSLDEQREADLGSDRLEVGPVGVGGGHDRDTRLDGDLARPVLAPHRIHHVCRRSDEHQPRVSHRTREGRALGQEAVAGVDGVCTRSGSGREQSRDRQVGVGCTGRADPRRHVRLTHVRCEAIGVGVDGHAAQARLRTRADHPQRDLPTVGDQDRSESHAAHIRKTP